ncbi:MAG TPA: hypothetical protein VFV38_18510 [Ktedonobacteraceae bacterium]|nr:hypothetical protein [Ktedonobacteraceae bacterium]
MSNGVDEIALLLDEVAKRWLPARQTFTEKEAMQSVWDAGYEIPIHSDARFVLVHEGDGKNHSHWRLTSHTVANTRLLNELLSGTWDGRDLDGKLATLDEEDQRHYVFYPLDARLSLTRQGVLEPAEHERNIKLPRGMKATLDALGPQLLAHWLEAGAEPWTVRTVTERLQQFSWSDADLPNAWLYVRAWLLNWPQVKRVGQDYWMPTEHVPTEVQRTRLQVHPLRIAEPPSGTEEAITTPLKQPSLATKPAPSPEADESQVVLRGEVRTDRASWMVRLRTVNLLEGFLHIPSTVRGAYPPPVPGEEQKTVLRGMWHEDGIRFWLWLDRTNNHLYGPALADRLMWLEAGTVLRIEWAPDIIVLQKIRQDEAVRDEEARLVDLEALAAVRGGLGENYRRSVQAILAEAPDGLAFAEIVIALRKRQQHEVHRGTIHAILYSGGFVCKDRRWFAAPDSEAGARQLRAAFVETLLPAEQETPAQPFSSTEYVRTRVKAIHARLSEIVTMLRETR